MRGVIVIFDGGFDRVASSAVLRCFLSGSSGPDVSRRGGLMLLAGVCLAALCAAGMPEVQAQQLVIDGTEVEITTPTTITEPRLPAIHVLNGGKLIATAPVTITTSGNGAHGMRVESNGIASFDGFSITVTNTGDGARANANGSITLRNGTIDVFHGSGLYASGTGAMITATDVVINKTGTASARGVYSDKGASVTLKNVGVTVTVAQSAGLFAFDGGSISATDVKVETRANSARGAEVNNNGRIDLKGGSVSTAGSSASGLYIIDGNAIITAEGTAVTTTGNNSHGLEGLSSISGSYLEMTDVTVRTSGTGAFGARLSSSRLIMTGGSILTKGVTAHGVVITFGSIGSLDGVAVETQGKDSAGLYFLGANSEVNAATIGNSRIIARQGAGVLVRGGAANTLALTDTDILSESGTLFDVRRRLVPGSSPAVPDDANPGRLTVVANGGSFRGASRPDDLSTVDFSLSNGNWTITTASADAVTPVSDLPLNTSRLNVLTVNDSAISFASEGGFKILQVDELRGSGALFGMNTDLGALAGDMLIFGTAEGSHRLMVRNSGSEPGAAGQHLRVVAVADPAATATFSLANIGGVVDAGTYRYALVRENVAAIGGEANDWALLNTSRLQPPGLVDPGPDDLSTPANAAVNTGDVGTAQSIWYAEMNALSKRLGELRLGHDEGGLWGRAFARGQKIDNKVGRGFDQTIGGFEIGLDGSVDVDGGRWYLGGVGGYSHANRDFSSHEGKGNTDSYHVGAYATFIADNGFYFDGILKLNHLQNDYTIRTTDGMRVDGGYSNAAMGLSFESGWRFRLQDGWFLEPQAELMLYRAEGAEYRTSNGMQVRVGVADSAQLRTSMMIGKVIGLSEGRTIQPYVKLGWIQEFAGSSTVWTNGIAHKSKLEGGRFDLDVGIMAQLGKHHHLYADYGYAAGSRLKEPWSLNVGYRYAW